MKQEKPNNTDRVTERVDFSGVRYAQCWEDADILLPAMNISKGDHCLSICSGGDNTLALLAKKPAKVVALDVSAAQLHCLELRVAAYRVLDHGQLLELMGSRESQRRSTLYRKCRYHLSRPARDFWNARPALIERGIGRVGRFEQYFSLFRRRVLPLIHGRRTVNELLQQRSPVERERFYAERWDNIRWRMLFRIFFSRFVMGHVGRDPEFFRYVDGGVSNYLLQRTRHALTELDPSANPYLQWILTGQHQSRLPFALREENFEIIRNNLDRLSWHQLSVEDYLAQYPRERFDAFNLSDVFEYLPVEQYHRLLQQLLAASRPGARLVYWNMMVPRTRPRSLASRLRPLTQLASRLHQRDKTFFYSRFVIEEVQS
jgi:S-adenosylmethionine-diacylglycerol 3-amino-3-carboxypropyl transferase